MPRDRLEAHGITAADIRGVADVTRLPISRKIDLRDQYPFGLLAVPRDMPRRAHGSSGTTDTTGKPTIVAYAANVDDQSPDHPDCHR